MHKGKVMMPCSMGCASMLAKQSGKEISLQSPFSLLQVGSACTVRESNVLDVLKASAFI